jgi:hypothetical protein
MKSKAINNTVAVLVLVIVLSLIKTITFLPWWFFVIPVHLMGVASYSMKWNFPGFATGFLAGFIVWAGANLYFDAVSKGDILARVGLMLSVSKIVVILVSGVIGGLLTALALYTGRQLFHRKTARLTFIDAKSAG